MVVVIFSLKQKGNRATLMEIVFPRLMQGGLFDGKRPIVNKIGCLKWGFWFDPKASKSWKAVALYKKSSRANWKKILVFCESLYMLLCSSFQFFSSIKLFVSKGSIIFSFSPSSYSFNFSSYFKIFKVLSCIFTVHLWFCTLFFSSFLSLLLFFLSEFLHQTSSFFKDLNFLFLPLILSYFQDIISFS